MPTDKADESDETTEEQMLAFVREVMAEPHTEMTLDEALRAWDEAEGEEMSEEQIERIIGRVRRSIKNGG